MDQLAADILDELCRTRRTLNAVVLAVDLVNRGRLKPLGDPFGLVCSVLADLNTEGLVVYTEGHGEVPVSIRATDLGYAAAGYRVVAKEVGQRRGAAPEVDGAIRHPDDPTEWRTQPSHTHGSEVERLPLAEHLARYPWHEPIHTPLLGGGLAMARNRMSKETVARVLDALDGERDVAAVAAQLSLHNSTVNYALQQAKEEGRATIVGTEASGGRPRFVWARTEADDQTEEPTPEAARSLREALIDLLRAGEVADSRDIPTLLRERGGRHDNLHHVQHLLLALERQGVVSLTRHALGRTQYFSNVGLRRIPPLGSTARERAIYEREVREATVQQAATAPVAADSAPPAPEPSGAPAPTRWVHLAALRQRVRERDARQQEANAFIEAAALLERYSPAEAARLTEAAYGMVDGLTLSPVEVEYLAFAAEVERAQDAPEVVDQDDATYGIIMGTGIPGGGEG